MFRAGGSTSITDTQPQDSSEKIVRRKKTKVYLFLVSCCVWCWDQHSFSDSFLDFLRSCWSFKHNCLIALFQRVGETWSIIFRVHWGGSVSTATLLCNPARISSRFVPWAQCLSLTVLPCPSLGILLLSIPSHGAPAGLAMRNTSPNVTPHIWPLNMLNPLHTVSRGLKFSWEFDFFFLLNLQSASTLSKLKCVSGLEILYSQLCAECNSV